MPTRPGVPRCTAFVTGPVRDGRIDRPGPPAAARGAGARPAPWNRRPGARKHRDGGDPWGLVHHSDHGSQYLSIAHAGRLVDEGTGRLGRKPWAPPCAGAAAQAPGKPPASAGPVLAQRPLEGPRRPLEAATARWVNWYNHTRPHLTNDDDLSPAAAEHRYHRNHTTTATA